MKVRIPVLLNGPEFSLVFNACNLNSKSMTHPAPTEHRPWLGMTQLIKLKRESVCDSENFNKKRPLVFDFELIQ